jgi:hypothetical protein
LTPLLLLVRAKWIWLVGSLCLSTPILCGTKFHAVIIGMVDV